MEKTRRLLSLLPSRIFSILTLAAILWLTLSPKPLGENAPPMFPGADKIAHGLMFGGFAAMMLLDWQRKHNWRMIGPGGLILSAIISSGVGIGIEYAQGSMDLGRGFEYSDMAADTIGAFSAVVFWMCFQRNWAKN